MTVPAATKGAAGVTRRLWLTGWLIAIPTLAAIAGLAGNTPAEFTRRTAVRRTDVHLDMAPPRKTVGLELNRNGWVYNCMECHTLLTAKWRYAQALNEHRDINLDHGNNRYCLNCHHPTNRNAFADYDGAEIAQGDIVQVCAKCHGTIFRDWQAGVHGRQNGYWRAQAGVKAKLECIQCHDPHQPRFPDMKPLAPLRYPPRAAGAPVSSFGIRVSGSDENRVPGRWIRRQFSGDATPPSVGRLGTLSLSNGPRLMAERSAFGRGEGAAAPPTDSSTALAARESVMHFVKRLADAEPHPNAKPETRNPKPTTARSAPAAP